MNAANGSGPVDRDVGRRLRLMASETGNYDLGDYWEICDVAADELDRLRAEVEALRYVLRVYVHARHGGEWHSVIEQQALALLTPNDKSTPEWGGKSDDI
jgi:hypothetical protein